MSGDERRGLVDGVPGKVLRMAECAICGYHGPAHKMAGLERAGELHEKGVIRDSTITPWVFCRPCRYHFANQRDKRP